MASLPTLYTFLDFLSESSKEGKNTHLYHLEENIFNGGVVGTRESITFLSAFLKMLSGNTTSRIAVTTKVDGAPAIVFGTDPESGRFFVATKHAAFGKIPKLSFTKEDIAKYHQGGLAEKLNIALEYLPSVVKEKAVFQGDMMFDSGTLSETTIRDEKYLTFQPNTIVYAVPESSDLAKTIRSKKMGIIVHTRYDGGPTIADMKATFKVDASKSFRTDSSTVWIRDANIISDFSGTATFTKEESDSFRAKLSEMGKIFRTIPAQVLNTIAENEEINLSILTFHNSKIRKGEEIANIDRHISEMKDFISDRYDRLAEKIKTEASKEKIIAKKKAVVSFLENNTSSIRTIMSLYNLMVETKLLAVRKLETLDKLSKFVRTPDGGYKVTADEGFVATDHLSGRTLKLVDRLEFSFNNFNAIKNWG